MGKKPTTRAARIAAEERRLRKIFGSIEEKRKDTIGGLIQRAAFMRVSCEDLEADLNANGFTELFQQGDRQAPYMRERPEAKVYATTNAGYQKIIKQLTDLLPKEKGQKEGGDAFEDF